MSNWGSNNAIAGQLTQDELNALAGTSGTPSATNEYVTDQDPRLALQDLEYFGDGSDGPSSPSSGTITFTRDMYYTTFTPSGTAQVIFNGFAIRCSVNLDLSNAPALCFTQQVSVAGSTNYGSDGSGTTGGAIATAGVGSGHQGSTANTSGWGTGLGGSAGGNASSGGSNVNMVNIQYHGGIGGVGGIGGAASVGGAGSIPGGITSTGASQYLNNILLSLGINLQTAMRIGMGGSGGGGGKTATTSGNGGGGGSGGGGASACPIFARTITRGASTSAGCISFVGGTGGNGAAGTTVTNQGGGGAGGGGGGGGLVYIVCRALAGVSKAGAIVATGGTGGNGAAGGGASAVGGTGGTGGDGGVIQIVNLGAGTITRTIGSTGSAATVASVQAGTTGGAGGACTAAL